MIFAIEKGFFATRWKLKLPLSAVVLVAVLLSQIRYGGELLFNTLQDLAVVFLIVGMGVFLLRHRLQNLYKEHGETDEIEVVATPLLQSQKKLMLPCDKFKRQDVSMAQGILAGKKYTAIASEQRMGLSTLKRRTKLLFKYARVANRQIFMAKYEGYTVELEIEDSVSPVVDSASHS
ncbi:MAG: hypothetical protein LBD79_04495 [Treponema sp.]|nr:hypothetical protein [Treponema sp.]